MAREVNHIQVYTAPAFSAFTMMWPDHLYFISEHFYLHGRNSGHHQSALCLYGFTHSGYSKYMESYSTTLCVWLISFSIKFFGSIPGGTGGKEVTCQCRRFKRLRSDPWMGKIPQRRTCHPLQYSCLENLPNRGAWRAIVHGIAESDWRDSAHTHACCSRYQSTSFKAEQHSMVWNPSVCDAHSGVSRFWLLWTVLLRMCLARACVSSYFQSSAVYTQEWNRWVMWCLSVSLFQEQPNCRPEQMIHVLSPAAKCSSSIIGPIFTNTSLFLKLLV